MTTARAFAVSLGLSAALLLTGCIGASQEDLDRAREAGASEAASKAAELQRTQELEDEVERLKQESQQNEAEARRAERRAIRAERRAANNQDSGGNTGTTTSATACGDGIYAGANTSCAFAMNVVGEYGSNPGASTINAYSPVTGQFYTMSCGTAANGGHVCTGGNNAAVYFP